MTEIEKVRQWIVRSSIEIVETGKKIRLAEKWLAKQVNKKREYQRKTTTH